MMRRPLVLLATLSVCLSVRADPCGMVPPVDTGDTPVIVRVGAQRTYVFFKDGVADIAIRPGFSGKVAQFGMLIPFPTPPAIRKVGDAVFEHLAAAIDPPAHEVDLEGQGAGGVIFSDSEESEGEDELTVLRQEAVGMYEVAVLDAGSPKALKRWMDAHGYHYPKGMDAACADYVKAGWCFVAVKTRVARKTDVDPSAGMREADPDQPDGFDGAVQAMGFRFRTKELVVPMRLSAFNAGKLRNIVYLLTPSPMKIRQLPDALVVRQIPGRVLRRNLTSLLPLVITGGSLKDVGREQWKEIVAARAPDPHNGLARDLIAGDLLAARLGRLSHPFEEAEKGLLAIGEALRLRGPELDGLHREGLAAQRRRAEAAAFAALDAMTLTVIDGDFPREVIAAHDLRFSPFTMAARRNTRGHYDAVLRGPGEPTPGAVGGGVRRGQPLGGWAVAAVLAGLALLGLARGRTR